MPATTSAVRGVPSWKVTPGRRVTSSVRPSSCHCQPVARTHSCLPCQSMVTSRSANRKFVRTARASTVSLPPRRSVSIGAGSCAGTPHPELPMPATAIARHTATTAATSGRVRRADRSSRLRMIAGPQTGKSRGTANRPTAIIGRCLSKPEGYKPSREPYLRGSGSISITHAHPASLGFLSAILTIWIFRFVRFLVSVLFYGLSS